MNNELIKIDEGNEFNEYDEIILSSNMLYDDDDNTVKKNNNNKKSLNSIFYNFCCICGKNYNDHNKVRHKFITASNEYTCKKCGFYFFQHTHNSRGCNFTPFKHISQ